jgi:hypothetical protein
MSAFVPGFEFDVFVSYAHVDNVALVPGKVSSGWVHTLVDGLRELLHQRLGRKEWGNIWIDPRLTGDLSLTPEIQQAVTHSATLMVILSEGYLNSMWCDRERKLFFEAASRRGDAEAHVFVVQQTEIERARWPREFADRVGYEFFRKERADASARTLGMPVPDPNEPAYFNQLDDLSRGLEKCLRNLQAAATPASTEPRPIPVVPTQNMATVFLAETTPDLEERRNNIRRHLEQLGLRVLPATYYNRAPADFKAAAATDLAESVLFVQLVGPYSTPKTADLPGGYEGLQLSLAQSLNKPIMRWRDPVLDTTSTRNPDLLAPDVMAMSFENFKRDVCEKVRLVTLLRPDKSPLAEGEIFTLVNVNTQDQSSAGEIRRMLEDYNIGYDIIDEKTPLLDLVQSEDYNYDALVVVYGQCDQAWVQSQIRECRQLMLRKKPSALIGAVYIAPPPNKPPLPIRPPKFHFFSNPNDAEFKKFIEAIQAKVAGQ